jgi:hypothetical protein
MCKVEVWSRHIGIAACPRSVQVAKCNSHTRPHGSSYFGIYGKKIIYNKQ